MSFVLQVVSFFIITIIRILLFLLRRPPNFILFFLKPICDWWSFSYIWFYKYIRLLNIILQGYLYITMSKYIYFEPIIIYKCNLLFKYYNRSVKTSFTYLQSDHYCMYFYYYLLVLYYYEDIFSSAVVVCWCCIFLCSVLNRIFNEYH